LQERSRERLEVDFSVCDSMVWIISVLNPDRDSKVLCYDIYLIRWFG
jgi:hypothetical protein